MSVHSPLLIGQGSVVPQSLNSLYIQHEWHLPHISVSSLFWWFNFRPWQGKKTRLASSSDLFTRLLSWNKGLAQRSGQLHGHKYQGLSHGHCRRHSQSYSHWWAHPAHILVSEFWGVCSICHLHWAPDWFSNFSRKRSAEIGAVLSQIWVSLVVDLWICGSKGLGQIPTLVFPVEPCCHSEPPNWSGLSWPILLGVFFGV